MMKVPSPTRRQARPATRAGRLCGAVGSLVLLAALITAPAGSATRAGRTASIPTCPAAGLVAWLDTNGDGTAGTIFFKLHFTNLSGHRCTVRGYPGVSAANPSGHGIGPGASRFTGSVRTITLNTGATAASNLGIVDALNFPPALCRPTTAAGLRVFAPGATQAKFVPFPFAACTHHVSLRISPVAAH
jgi:hypothetical protein